MKKRLTATPFTASHGTLLAGFHDNGIQPITPDFCDLPRFVTIERSNPVPLLNHFASFVAKRPYDQSYLSRASAVIPALCDLLHAELVSHGRLSACVDISGILLRALHRENVWACCIKGSLTIRFPPSASLEPRYFWSVDHGDFVAGHAWLFAPPYTVVDIASRQQPYLPDERYFIPDKVLACNPPRERIDTVDVVSPSARAELLAHGVREDRLLYAIKSALPHISSVFPAVKVLTDTGASLKYIPVAITGPDGTFEQMTNMMFNGLTPWELYTKKLAPRLRELGF